MTKIPTLSALTLAALVAAAPAFAQEALPATYLVHKLTADGVEVRSLEAERGVYEARVAATDGTIVKVGIDPQTAELTDAYSHAKPRPATVPAPRLNASQAIMVAAATGYWDVSEVGYKTGVWHVTARDDQGRSRTVHVDDVSGAVD